MEQCATALVIMRQTTIQERDQGYQGRNGKLGKSRKMRTTGMTGFVCKVSLILTSILKVLQ